MNGFEFGNDGPSVVLVAIDGSTTSMRAGAYAAGLARRQRADLVVVTVFSTPALANMSADAVPAMTETAAAAAADLQEEGREALRRLEMEARFLRVHGDPYTEIVRIADELRTDLVVVGASTKAGHRLIGSLAGRLVKAGKWPVTVVP